MNPMQRMIIAKAAYQAPPMARSEIPLSSDNYSNNAIGNIHSDVIYGDGTATISSSSNLTMYEGAYTPESKDFPIDWPASELRIFELKSLVFPTTAPTTAAMIVFQFRAAACGLLKSGRFYANGIGSGFAISDDAPIGTDSFAVGFAGDGDFCMIVNGMAFWQQGENLPLTSHGYYGYGIPITPISGSEGEHLSMLLRRQAHTFELSYPDMSSHGITVLADIDGTPLPASLTA